MAWVCKTSVKELEEKMTLYSLNGKDYDLDLPVDWDEPSLITDLKSLRVNVNQDNFKPFTGFIETKKTNKQALEKMLGLFEPSRNLVFSNISAIVKGDEKEALVCCYLLFYKIRLYKFLTFSDLFEIHFTSSTGTSISSITRDFDSFILDLGTEDYHSKYNDVPVGCFLDNIENSSKTCLIIYRGNKNLDQSIKTRIENEPRWFKINYPDLQKTEDPWKNKRLST